jgi:hypothetical protein
MTDLERRILDQIEKRGLAPRPYAFFLAKRSVFWTLAVLSVVLGAVAVAVMIHGAFDVLATGERGLDEMPFEDLFESLPFVWLVLLALFVASALFGVYNTKRGYRYRARRVAFGAVLASAILGALLHRFDVGRQIHRYLNAHVPAYERLVRSREDEWSAPDAGKLGGKVVAADGRTLTLRDFRGGEWTVDIAGAAITLSEPPLQEGIVALRGVRTGPAAFRATSVEEWD